MATVTGLTATRMLAIEAQCIVSGAIVTNDLILTKQNGTTVNAGNVRGPQGVAGTTGATGATGPTGSAGAAGVNGNTLLNGTATPPSSGLGANGDFYFNTSTNVIYGPKASGTWPAGVSIIGATGATGPTGPAGTSVTIVGTVANAAALPTGLNGTTDVGKGYIANDTGNLHVWSGSAFTNVGAVRGPTGLTGATGSTGATGATGAAGANGNTLLSGTATPPSGGTGVNGDFYLNTSTSVIYGPKAAGVWPAGVSIIGATGAAGATGATGAAGATGATGTAGQGVPAGGTANQILSKINGTDYNTQWITSPYADKTPTVGTSLATTGTNNLDLAALNDTFQSIAALTGAITFTTSNRTAGKSVTIRIINGATLRAFTFPGWTFVGAAAPASIAASKTGILTLTCFGTAESDVVAAWAVQP